MKQTKVYICHPYETYGTPKENLRQEAIFVKYLKSIEEDHSNIKYIRPFKLIDPSLSRDKAMEKCFKLIDTCDALIASSDAYRSLGCLDEMIYAQTNNKDVLILNPMKLKQRDYEWNLKQRDKLKELYERKQ